MPELVAATEPSDLGDDRPEPDQPAAVQAADHDGRRQPGLHHESLEEREPADHDHRPAEDDVHARRDSLEVDVVPPQAPS